MDNPSVKVALGNIGLEPKGVYSPTKTYQRLNVVSYNNSSYVAIKSSAGIVPTNTEYWKPLVDMTDVVEELREAASRADYDDTEIREDISELQDDVEDIKRRIDSGDISIPDGSGSSIIEEKNAYHLRLAKIQYTSFGDSYWGTTPEEKARNIAKFDIHVSGSINSDTLPIIRRAKEINPNLKICAYISVASGRPSFDKDSNDLSKPWGWYTFRRDGSWDNEYGSKFFPVYGVNLTIPFNKWQILQQIEEFAHVGGHKTGEQELVDTYTWIDENGVSHTDEKYIDKWVGGTSYDGIFWDDVGFDHIIDEGTFFETDNSTEPIDSVKRQGFASRRDKYICINNFTHDRGMFVIPNGIGKEDLYDPAISNENPDGLGSSLTENDYVFVESFLSMIGTANSVNWRNEVNRVKTYMDDWYDKVKAKVIVEDYGYPMMDKETLNQFTTYAMATCVALGVHYYSITNVDNSLYVPNVIDLPVPTDESDRKAHLTRPASDIVKYSYAEDTLSVIRNSELTRGEVTKYSILNGIKILLNGNRLYNAFISAAESDAGLSDKLKELKTSIDESISDTKQSASIYNRLMIDDWSVDKLEYTKLITNEAFTEFAQGSQNRFASDENVDVAYDVSERTITWTKNAADGNGMQSVPLNIRINRDHYGHTIEVGYAIRTTGTGVGAWLDMRLDGDLWYEDGANPAKNTSSLYPSRADMSVRRRTLIDYGDRDFVPLQFIATWNVNCLSATIENFYVIDIDEFDMDVSKTEYTNLMPAYEPNIQLGASRSFIMLPGSNSKSFTIDFENGAQPYNNGDGAGWWLDKSIFTPGHTYEIGIKDVERNSGSYAMKLNIRIGLGDDDYIRNTVEFHEKYGSKIFPEIKTYNRRFTIPEDAVLTNPLLEFASYYGDYNNQEGTKPKSIVVHDWYLFDCDEENVIIRGVTPAQTSIRICRVTEESLSKDIQNETLINNALYLTDTGKIYFTDVNKSLVKEERSSGVSDKVTPEQFGAIGDGVHDDAQALKSALESGKPVVLTQDLYIKTPVSIINCDAYLDGNNYTIYEDFEGDTNWYTGLMFYASSLPKSDKTVLRVLTSNKTYDTADYTGQSGGSTDYKYGYLSYKGKDPVHGAAFLDWELGDDYTEYCYEEHVATVKNLVIKGTHVAGHILLGFSQLCHGLIDNVRVYALDGDCQGGIRIFRCHDVICRSSWAENVAPMTTWNTVGNAGYGFSIDGDCIQVVNCGGWNNKDELCIGGDRGCWSTSIIVDGFTCGCIDDPNLKYGGMYRFADRFNCHSAVINPTIKNVYCHITNPSGRGIEAFAIRCPEVTLENIHIDTDQQGAVIRFYEIVQNVHIKNLYAPQCMMQISTLNPYMFNSIDIDGGEIFRILNADYKTEMHLHNVRIKQFIDSVQRIWMTDCIIECDVGEWMSPVALNVTEEAWLTNSVFSSNPSEYISLLTPIIKAPADSVYASNCKFYKRLNRKTFITEQNHIVNCGEYNIAEAKLDNRSTLNEAQLA